MGDSILVSEHIDELEKFMQNGITDSLLNIIKIAAVILMLLAITACLIDILYIHFPSIRKWKIFNIVVKEDTKKIAEVSDTLEQSGFERVNTNSRIETANAMLNNMLKEIDEQIKHVETTTQNKTMTKEINKVASYLKVLQVKIDSSLGVDKILAYVNVELAYEEYEKNQGFFKLIANRGEC